MPYKIINRRDIGAISLYDDEMEDIILSCTFE